MDLPMVSDRPERRDAARNRLRILDAARRVLRERGAEALTMDAVATTAGVGKATIFRRFGDRGGLIHALLDDYMRDFQEAFLHGPPPLGPGAPAAERLEAFALELVRMGDEHLDLVGLAEGDPGTVRSTVYGVLFVHVGALLAELDPAHDPAVLATLLLGALAPPVVADLRRDPAARPAEVQRALRVLLRGVTGAAA